MLLRGCVLRNTATVVGVVSGAVSIYPYLACIYYCWSFIVIPQVVYAGHDTKAMLNNTGPRSKRSKLEREMNRQVNSKQGALSLSSAI